MYECVRGSRGLVGTRMRGIGVQIIQNNRSLQTSIAKGQSTIKLFQISYNLGKFRLTIIKLDAS